jgi:hypothetical protein
MLFLMKRCSLASQQRMTGELSFAEFNTALQRVGDEEIYLEILKDITFRIAPDNLNSNSIYVKRPGLNNYKTIQ